MRETRRRYRVVAVELEGNDWHRRCCTDTQEQSGWHLARLQLVLDLGSRQWIREETAQSRQRLYATKSAADE